MNNSITAPDTEPKLPPVRSWPRRVQGVELRTFEDMWRFADCIVQARMAPKGMETQQAVVIAIQLGAECGLGPMASLQNVAVINGRPSIFGDAQMAIIRGSGTFDDKAYEEHMEGTEGKDDWTACVTMSRIGGNPQTGRFSVAEAKTAGLWGAKDTWKKYPKDMLFWRARARVMRRLFSDSLRGIISVEEARDIPPMQMIEQPPADANGLEHARPSSSKTEALAAELSPKQDPQEAPPTVPDQEPENPEPAQDEAPAKQPTQAQLRTYIQAKWLNLNKAEPDDGAAGKKWLEDHGLASIDELRQVLGLARLNILLDSLA